VRAFESATGLLGRIAPLDQHSLTRVHRLSVPLYTPAAPLVGDDERMLDVSPLYAGECVRAITKVVGAGEAVRDLAAGWR
jgi:hypothetical protein